MEINAVIKKFLKYYRTNKYRKLSQLHGQYKSLMSIMYAFKIIFEEKYIKM